MKATIDRSGCIGCGLCPSICPEVFQMADDGLAEVIVDTVPADAEGTAEEAQENCPVSVIIIE
jgi:ferredoxin